MVHYRRCKINGGTYFFTVTLNNRASTLLTDYIDDLKSAIREVKSSWPFAINAMVVLPEHLHTIWQLPENDHDYATRWRLIKRNFTKSLITRGIHLDKNRHGLYKLWQRRFWEHIIRNEQDYINHVNYIHFNPVKHRYVISAKDWPYSTFHEYVRQGLLGEDWGCAEGSLIKHANTKLLSHSSYGERDELF
jgi:putative transposase